MGKGTMGFTVAGLVACALACGALACGGDEEQTVEPLKVGFVYVTSIGDGGWTYAHNEGRLQVEAQLDNVQTFFVENVSDADSDAVVAALEGLVAQGCELIFTTSYGFMDPTLVVANRHPELYFEHCSGWKTAPNMTNYFGRMYQARYLTGVVAGHMTQTDIIGYVAAFPIPEVIRMINAFTLGVRSVNPDAEVHVGWTYTWYDPALETDAATELLALGADVMAQHQDSTATVLAARDAGAYAIGYDGDMLSYAPDTVLTSAVWHWGVYYLRRVQAVLAGTWNNTPTWMSMADGIVGLGSYGAMVPQPVKDEVATAKAALEAGTFDVFDGPLYYQDGSTWLTAGQSLTDAQLLSMMDFVAGVVGDY